MYAYATKAATDASTFVKASNWNDILATFHAAKVDDQFIPPLVLVDEQHAPIGVVREADIVVYFDYRTDRAKPLTAAFLGIPYGGQVGGLSAEAAAKRPKNVRFVTMTNYDDAFMGSTNLGIAFVCIVVVVGPRKKKPCNFMPSFAFDDGFLLLYVFFLLLVCVLFIFQNPAEPLSETYAEVVGQAGVSQLVCAESEKWRAVTWFKDGRRNLGYSRYERLSFVSSLPMKHADDASKFQ